jgi:hypothetical protein
LPPATRAAFGFALAIARTSAKDWLATASASRLDPTPAVTVGRLQPLRVFRNALCVPALLKGNSFLFSKKASKKERKNKKKKAIKKDFKNFFGLFWKENF